MNYDKKLDTILRVLLRNLPTYMTQLEIENKISKIEVHDHMWLEMHLIIDKLIDDGYVKKYIISVVNLNTKDSVDTPHFEITFKGKMFIQEGGYEGHYLKLASESIRLGKLDENQKSTNENMVFLTRVVAFGTTVAAIYYLLEVLKYFCVIPKSF